MAARPLLIELNVEHVREPGQRVPVALLEGSEGPVDAFLAVGDILGPRNWPFGVALLFGVALFLGSGLRLGTGFCFRVLPFSAKQGKTAEHVEIVVDVPWVVEIDELHLPDGKIS